MLFYERTLLHLAFFPWVHTMALIDTHIHFSRIACFQGAALKESGCDYASGKGFGGGNAFNIFTRITPNKGDAVSSNRFKEV